MDEFPSDALPPEAIYSTKEALREAINSWSRDRGYALTVGRSKLERTGLYTITYACDRRGLPQSTHRMRQTSSRRCGCYFSINAKELPDGNGWALRHRPDPTFAVHNHAASIRPTAHPTHRQLRPEDQASIVSLLEAKMPLKYIRTWLTQNTDSCATARDLYNLVAKLRREAFAASAAASLAEFRAAVSAANVAYDSPEAIYERYEAARDFWYKQQPRGAIKTNQAYRQAHNLPLQFEKEAYDWCLDWKQMNEGCLVGSRRRPWTKAEMMAYLDFTEAENERIEAVVREMMAAAGYRTQYRGPDAVWKFAEEDGNAQEEKYRRLKHHNENSGR